MTAGSDPKVPGPMTVPLERADIIAAYRLFFGREPESAAVIDEHLLRLPDRSALRVAMLGSLEFREKAKGLVGQVFPAKPLHWPPLRVDVDVTPAQLTQMLALVEGNWEALGRSEPHWSVLTNDRFKAKNIAASEASFHASGQRSANRIAWAAARCGVDLDALRSCVELGCGVGRISLWLARRFETVLGVDISRPHLFLAESAAAREGVANVAFRHINTLRALGELPRFDALYSLIVLQHNPPPVMHAILDTLLPRLNPGGIAYFQVPTYAQGYSFDAEAYLASAAVRGEMEVHVLPQPYVFALAERHACRLLEVREDDSTGGPKWISQAFLLQKHG